MKIKVLPEDFQVREESDLPVSLNPDSYRVYRLSKRGWNTFDLAGRLARDLGLRRADIGFGGIKDRHSLSEQLVTLKNVRALPDRIEDKGFSLLLQGYASRPTHPQDVRGNHFLLTLRDLDPSETDNLSRAAEEARRWGLPNYFDAQRFASARHGQGFMGKAIFMGHREEALRLFFQPCRQDPPAERRLKSFIQEHWGQWRACLSEARGECRPLLAYLADHPRAFTKALGRIDRRYLTLVLNAYQSHLFNRLLSLSLLDLAKERGFDLLAVPGPPSSGELLFYRELPSDLFTALKERRLPVPGHDSRSEDEETRRALAHTLAQEGIRLQELRVRQIQRLRVGGSERKMIVLPEDLTVLEVKDDDRYQGRKKLIMSCFLPRGCYATLVIKRMALPAAA